MATALPAVEGGEIRRVAERRNKYSFSFEVFEGLGNVENRFDTAGDDGNAALAQFGQVSGNV
jgi:hypothetical protein